MNRIFTLPVIFLLTLSGAYSQSWNISLKLKDATCKGANDGQINLIVDGSDVVNDTIYSWEWLDSAGNVFDTISDPVQHLSPGSYLVNVTRLADGSMISASGTISESDSILSVTKSVMQENFCSGDAAGIVEATASGGSGGYMYGLGKGTASTEPDYTKGYAENAGVFRSLPAGTYCVWARDSKGCEVKTSAFTITEPKPITIVYEVVDADCDDTGGQIVINSISGGTPFDVNQAGSFNFQIEWKDAAKDSTIAVNEASISALPSGPYQVIITDKNGCVQVLPIDVQLGYKFEVIRIRDVSCNLEKNGLIRVELTAYSTMQEPFSLRVRDENGNEITSLARSNVSSGNVNFSGLGPGTYTIEAMDALGCVKEQQATLREPGKLRLEEISVTDIKCKGSHTGEIFFQVSGGSGDYFFSVDSGANYSPDPTFSGLPAGTYDLFVKDGSGCILNAGDVYLSEPSTGYKVEKIEVTDVLCNGKNNGAIELFFSDSTSPAHLNEDEDIIWANSSEEIIQKGSQVITGLSAGRYRVKISDDYGCNYNKLVSVDNIYELRADFSMEAERFAVDYPIELEDKSLGQGIVRWLWDFGDERGSVLPNPTVTYKKEGTYVLTLTVENEVGCVLSAKDTVDIEKGFNFTVPTAFTPNGDQLNDHFRPKFDNVKKMRMRVINGAGAIVYESDELSASWDGNFEEKEAPQGPYYFEIEYTTGSGATRKEKGKVFLLR